MTRGSVQEELSQVSQTGGGREMAGGFHGAFCKKEQRRAGGVCIGQFWDTGCASVGYVDLGCLGQGDGNSE